MKSLILGLALTMTSITALAETTVDIEYANDGTIPADVYVLNNSPTYIVSRDPKLPNIFITGKEKRRRTVRAIYSVNSYKTANLKSLDEKTQGYLMAKYCDITAKEVDLDIQDSNTKTNDSWITVTVANPLKPKTLEVTSDIDGDGKISYEKEYKEITCP